MLAPLTINSPATYLLRSETKKTSNPASVILQRLSEMPLSNHFGKTTTSKLQTTAAESTLKAKWVCPPPGWKRAKRVSLVTSTAISSKIWEAWIRKWTKLKWFSHRKMKIWRAMRTYRRWWEVPILRIEYWCLKIRRICRRRAECPWELTPKNMNWNSQVGRSESNRLTILLYKRICE